MNQREKSPLCTLHKGEKAEFLIAQIALIVC